ncbi:MAG: hypothetical protein ACFB21_10180 [Opitutales bacterium]
MIKKSLLSLCLAGALFSGSVYAQDVEERDLARKALATQSAARFLASEMETLAAGEPETLAFLEGQLEDAMLANVPEHQQRSASRELSLENFRELLQAEFADRLAEAVAIARLQSPLPVSEAEVIARLGEGAWTTRQQTTLTDLTQNRFGPTFDDARLRAVLLQRYQLETGVDYPEYAELNTRLSALLEDAEGDQIPATAFEELRPWLGPFDESAEGIVFEELDAMQRDAVGQKLLQIQGQYNRQVGMVDEVATLSRVPDNAIRVGAITNFLVDHVERNLNVQEPDETSGNAPVYPVFSATRTYARARAGELEAERLQSFLEGLAIRSPNPSQLREAMLQNLDAHMEREASFELLMEDQLNNLIPQVANQFTQQMGGGNDVRNYLIERLEAESPLRSNLSAKIAESLSPAFDTAREELAQVQLRDTFPIVVDNRPLPEDLVQRLYFDSVNPAQDVSFERVLAIFRQHPVLGESLIRQPNLIEEAEDAVVEYYNRASFNGVAALRRQMAAVAEVERDNLDELERQVRANVPLENLEEQWLTEFQREWRGDRLYAQTVYQEPFDMARSTLLKAVRQFYTSTEVVGPPPPPGELPNLVFAWNRDEYRELQLERAEWRARYGEAYEEYQRIQEEKEAEMEDIWITPVSRTRPDVGPGQDDEEEDADDEEGGFWDFLWFF